MDQLSGILLYPIPDAILKHVSELPFYHVAFEGFLIILVIWLLRRKSYRPSEVHALTEKEKDDLVAEWQPEPLVPALSARERALLEQTVYVDGKLGKRLEINGHDCLNMATLNFLNLVGDERIEEASVKAIEKYGVGSCGPRGFYGTVDVHLKLEERLAAFMRCEEAVLYSYGFACISSAIPAYAKRGDVIFCDKGVNFAIQMGLLASRSRIEFFNHNDVEDLERLLKIQAEKDKENPKKAKVTRRFLVVEGIYLNTADVCPLPQLLELKWKYKVRIFIDESLSFGVLGATGRGVTEHFGVDIIDVDMICASLEYAVASTGGFCVGRTYVVDHQRLSGLGYCFSASLPPLLAVAAIEALTIMENEPERFDKLRENSKLLYNHLSRLKHFDVVGFSGAPVIHIRVCNSSECKRELIEQLLEEIVLRARNEGLVLTVARYLVEEERFPPEPSIRVSVNCSLTADEIQQAVQVIERVSKDVFLDQLDN